MKKILVAIIFTVTALPGYLLWYFSHSPDQDVFWDDSMTQLVRKTEKGEFNKNNQGVKWLSLRDMETMELEGRYHKFSGTLEAMRQRQLGRR